MGLPGRGGYLLADKGLVVGVGIWRSEGFGGYMQVGWAADTVGCKPVGMELEQGVAGRGWGQDIYLLGLVGSDHHAS